MRKIVLAINLVILSIIPAHYPYASDNRSEIMTLNGIIIDQACAEEHKSDILSYIKNHTKECALKPGNQARGYSLITPDMEVTPFAPKSNPKIVAYLKQTKNKMRVTVKARLINGQLVFITITNIITPKIKPKTQTVKK
jgi:hypothetical protein